MDTDTKRIIFAGLIFTVIFVSGYLLKRTGKRYNVFLVTFHKVIAVAAFVLLIAIKIRLNASGTLQLLNGVVAGLFFVLVRKR
ncbi:hypothetical protein JW935_27205 [candidate division KSB1 bacterium]|nr:hypothetical protein [candidate division KSB1 bacterium]